MIPLRIIGAGGHGRVVADVARTMGYRDIGFLDAQYPERRTNGEWPVIGTSSWQGEGVRFCAVGENATRAAIFNTAGLQDAPVLVHPFSCLALDVLLGAGTLVVAGVIVNVGTCVGAGVILNTGCSVDHDCVLDDFVHISPGARLAGNVHIGTRSWIGIGAVIREGVHVGKDVIVAAGSAVINDLTDGSRVGGIPAKSI